MGKLHTVEELHAMAIEHARDCLVDVEGASLIPTFWVQFRDGPGEMLVAPWTDEAEKVATIEAVRAKLKDPRARNYCFVSEVWVATQDVRSVDKRPPMDRPDRREEVMVMAFSRSGKGGVKSYAIKRDAAGVVEALVEEKNEVEFQGRMFNLFLDEKLQHAVVRRETPDARAKRAVKEQTTRTPLNHCLDCGMVVSAGTPTDPNRADYRPPRPGDVAICLHCAHIMAYANDLMVRALTDDEMVEIAGDPDIVRAVNAIADLNKREHGVG